MSESTSLRQHGPVAAVDQSGRHQVVRNGYLLERPMLTGLGPIDIKKPRVHDREDLIP